MTDSEDCTRRLKTHPIRPISISRVPTHAVRGEDRRRAADREVAGLAHHPAWHTSYWGSTAWHPRAPSRRCTRSLQCCCPALRWPKVEHGRRKPGARRAAARCRHGGCHARNPATLRAVCALALRVVASASGVFYAAATAAAPCTGGVEAALPAGGGGPAALLRVVLPLHRCRWVRCATAQSEAPQCDRLSLRKPSAAALTPLLVSLRAASQTALRTCL